MIEGGGLGVYTPDEVGPMSVQVPNGVVDIAVDDEPAAVAAAKKYLSYFQGAVVHWQAGDQKAQRLLIPENRLRIYDIRAVIAALADTDSVLELRPLFAPGMITALVRIEGHAFGLIANNPMHLAGAIDAPCADKAARFLQLCDGFGLPVVSLCDTPGFMVGPEAEKAALVRRTSRMFVVSGTMTTAMFTIVLRKGYGLGAQAMAGGSFHAPFFIVSWPTGEFGGMGLEGAVRLGYRKELEAEPTPEAREALFRKKVAESYARGKAINMAAYLEIDDVIDPADTRRWILRGLKSLPPRENGGRRAFIDTW
jgi:acetyl-CoA carboxylase carboxyltransferase component